MFDRVLNTVGGLLSCSFAANFQETITTMIESVFSKVCYIVKYKLHYRLLMFKFSEILTVARRKIFSAFYPLLFQFYLKLFLIALVSLSCKSSSFGKDWSGNCLHPSIPHIFFLLSWYNMIRNIFVQS